MLTLLLHKQTKIDLLHKGEELCPEGGGSHVTLVKKSPIEINNRQELLKNL